MRSSGRERYGRLGTWVAILFLAIVLTGCVCCGDVEQAYPVAHCLPPDCCGMSPYWGGQVLAPEWGPAPNVPYPPSSSGRAVPPGMGPQPYPVHGGAAAKPLDGGGPGPTQGPTYPVVCVCVVNQTASVVQGHVGLQCQNGPPIVVNIAAPLPQGSHQCWPINPPCIAYRAEYDLGVCRGVCLPTSPPPSGPVTLIVCAQGGGPLGPVTCTCVLHPGPCPADPAQYCPPYKPH